MSQGAAGASLSAPLPADRRGHGRSSLPWNGNDETRGCPDEVDLGRRRTAETLMRAEIPEPLPHPEALKHPAKDPARKTACLTRDEVRRPAAGGVVLMTPRFSRRTETAAHFESRGVKTPSSHV